MDIANVVVAWLEGLGIDAYHSVPSQRPERFAVVGVTGNPSEETTLHQATVSVTMWDADGQRLRDDAREAVISRYQLMEVPNIFGTSIINEYDDFDYESDMSIRVILIAVLVEY